MAPIYTARHIGSSDKTIPLFTTRGLKDLAPAPLSALIVNGVGLEKQVAYAQYIDSLEYFIHATSKQVTTLITGAPLGFLQTGFKLPLLPPPVQFTMQKELTPDQSVQFVTSLGTGASKEKVGRTTVFSTPFIPTEKLDKMIRVTNSHYNAGRDAITPVGLKAFNFINGCLAEFLRTHTYAAFHNETLESLATMNGLLAGKTGWGTSCYNITKDTNLKELSRIIQNEPDADAMVDDEEEEVSLYSQAVEQAKKVKMYFSADGCDLVTKAKPSPGREKNYGPSSSVPNMSGNVFPYFEGLIQPDFTTISNFVIRRLFRLLGQTVQDCQEMFTQLRRGINSLSTTASGMAMAHIIFGVELALHTQCRCYLLFDLNKYNGFVLLGARYAIFDSTKWSAPETEEQLRKDLECLDPHANAVEQLVQLFGELTTSGAYKGEVVTKESFKSPSTLPGIFAKLNLSDMEEEVEKQIDNHLRCLNYMGDGYLARDPGQIAAALELIFSDTVVTLDKPTYIPSLRSNLGDRSFIVLSRFGPEAPSLWNERGSEYVCSSREVTSVVTGGKRKAADDDIYANMPTKILITPKPLHVAVKDMAKVQERGAVRMDLKERAGKYRSICVEAEGMRKRIWKVLVDGMVEQQAKRRKVGEKKKDTVEAGFDDVLADLMA